MIDPSDYWIFRKTKLKKCVLNRLMRQDYSQDFFNLVFPKHQRIKGGKNI